VNHVHASLLASLLFIPLIASGQPRVDEQRPLVRALHAAERAFERQDYGVAIRTISGRLDTLLGSEPRAEALFLLARSYHELGRHRAARAAAGDLIAGYPLDRHVPEATYIYGVSSFASGSLAEARGAFATAARKSASDRGRALYWLGRINADEGRIDTAADFATLSLREPEHEFSDNARYLIAWAHESHDELDTASVHYRRLIERNPRGDLVLDAQVRLGVIEARRGNFDNAERILRVVTPRSDRQREERLFYLSEAQSALGRHQEALQGYTDYVRSFPASPRDRIARYGIGWSQLQLGSLDEAVVTFRQLEGGIDSIAAASAYQVGAIELARGDTATAMTTLQALLFRLPYESFSDNANYQLARIFYRRAAYDSSRHYSLVTARQFPQSDVRPQAYYLLGESYVALGDPKNAAYAFARSRKVGADDRLAQRALYREGIMLYRAGRFQSAVDRFRQYLAEYGEGPQAPDASFWLGEALYQDRSYAEAERYYSAYLEQTRSDTWKEQAMYGLAWSRFQQGEFQEAALAFEQFRTSYPSSDRAIDATLRQADAYRFLRQYDRALATYESIGTDNGGRTEEARFRMAEVFLQMGEVERSVDAFRALVHDYPTSPLRDAYAYNIGSIYRQKEMDSAAIAEFGRFLDEFPESQLRPQALFTIGDAWFNREEFDSALIYYRRVLDEHPSHSIVPEALDAVRYALNAMGRGSEALAIIDEFQQKNPDRLPADSLAYRKATIMLEEGAIDTAVVRFRRLIAEHPESPLVSDALFQIGRGYEYRNLNDSALIIYDSVASAYPQTTAGHDALIDGAQLRLRLGRWVDARHGFEDFVEHHPQSDRVVEANYGHARCRLALGDTAEAMAGFQSIVDSASASEQDIFVDRSRIELARIATAAAAYDRALALLASVVARRRDDLAAESLLLRSEILVATRDYSGALAELRQLTDEYSDYAEYSEPGLFRLGNLYEMLTNFEAARTAYNELIQKTSDLQLRASAETRLKGMKR